MIPSPVERRVLTVEEAAGIRWRWQNRDTIASLAAEFGVSATTINRAIAGKYPDRNKRPKPKDRDPNAEPRKYQRKPDAVERMAARREAVAAERRAAFDGLAETLGRAPSQVEFAQHMGFTRERARQIISALGLPAADGNVIRQSTRRARTDDAVIAAVAALRAEGKPVSFTAVAERSGLKPSNCHKAMKRLGVEVDPRSGLDDERVAAMRALRDSGLSYKAIAHEFGCATMTAYLALHPEYADQKKAARSEWYRRAKERDPEAIRRRNVEAGRRYRERIAASQQAAE